MRCRDFSKMGEERSYSVLSEDAHQMVMSVWRPPVVVLWLVKKNVRNKGRTGTSWLRP